MAGRLQNKQFRTWDQKGLWTIASCSVCAEPPSTVSGLCGYLASLKLMVRGGGARHIFRNLSGKFFLSHRAQNCVAGLWAHTSRLRFPGSEFTRQESRLGACNSHFWTAAWNADLEKPTGTCWRRRADSAVSTACLRDFTMKGADSSTTIFRKCMSAPQRAWLSLSPAPPHTLTRRAQGRNLTRGSPREKRAISGVTDRLVFNVINTFIFLQFITSDHHRRADALEGTIRKNVCLNF